MLRSGLKQEFFRYLAVGGIAFLVDMAVLSGLVAGLGWNYLHAALLAFLAGTWANYELSVRWVFSHREIQRRGVEFGLFLLIGVVNLALSLGIMAFLVEDEGIHYILAKCAATVFTLTANFSARRAMLFTGWRLPARAAVKEQP